MPPEADKDHPHRQGRNTGTEPKWLEISQFRDTYRIGRTKIYELIAQKQLEMVKLGRKSLISVASAERLFANLPRAGM